MRYIQPLSLSNIFRTDSNCVVSFIANNVFYSEESKNKRKELWRYDMLYDRYFEKLNERDENDTRQGCFLSPMI